MTDDKLYQIFRVNNSEVFETSEFITLSNFKKKFPNYFYSENCLHKTNYLEIMSKVSENDSLMIIIKSNI